MYIDLKDNLIFDCSNGTIEKYLKGYYAGYITSAEAIEMIDTINVCYDYSQHDMVNRTVAKLTNN